MSCSTSIRPRHCPRSLTGDTLYLVVAALRAFGGCDLNWDRVDSGASRHVAPCRPRVGQRLGQDLAGRPSDDAARRLVEVQHPISLVHHQEAVTHVLDERVSRDRYKGEQTEAEESPGDDHSGETEDGRRVVLGGERSRDEEIDGIPCQGEAESAQQDQRLAPVEWRRQLERAHQEVNGERQHEVAVGRVDPEPGAEHSPDDRERTPFVEPDDGAHEVVVIVGPHQDYRGQRQEAQGGDTPPIEPPATPGSVEGHGEPRHRDGGDGQILDVRPEDLGLEPHRQHLQSSGHATRGRRTS